jgi:hypothetical protein
VGRCALRSLPSKSGPSTQHRKTRHLLLERQGIGREGPVRHRGVEYLKNKDVGIGL